MSKAIEELLVSVARQIAGDLVQEAPKEEEVEIALHWLRERLGPALEAGQAMRDTHPCWNPLNTISDTLGLAKESILHWDAALAAGKGQV